jgi:hypothetical protein
MHEYMEDAFAEALGISHDELEAKLDEGETMWSIAQAQGLSDDEIAQLMVDARTNALEKAVADGVLTQEQAIGDPAQHSMVCPGAHDGGFAWPGSRLQFRVGVRFSKPNRKQ